MTPITSHSSHQSFINTNHSFTVLSAEREVMLLAQARTNPQIQNVFGTIEAPEPVQRYGLIGSPGSQGGPTAFISNIIILVTVVAGIWALINVLLAGFTLVTSDGDSKKISEMSSKITNTFIGLLVMVAAPLIAAIFGLFLFGRADYFLNPQIFGPGV
jgi:hypothetical protein